MSDRLIRVLFIVAGLYDGVLGVAFLFFGGKIFEFHDVAPPNHEAYYQFPALLLIVFAALFFRVAADPVKNRSLIPYGCGLKVAYCLTVFWHSICSGIPSMWIAWAWADLVLLALFVWAWKTLGRSAA